jgi:hypothetical protein
VGRTAPWTFSPCRLPVYLIAAVHCLPSAHHGDHGFGRKIALLGAPLRCAQVEPTSAIGSHALNNLTWTSAGRAAISSRSSVPRSAYSNSPVCACRLRCELLLRSRIFHGRHATRVAPHSRNCRRAHCGMENDLKSPSNQLLFCSRRTAYSVGRSPRPLDLVNKMERIASHFRVVLVGQSAGHALA